MSGEVSDRVGLMFCAHACRADWRMRGERANSARARMGLVHALEEPDGWFCSFCGKRVMVARPLTPGGRRRYRGL